jgi:hypothetical protein
VSRPALKSAERQLRKEASLSAHRLCACYIHKLMKLQDASPTRSHLTQHLCWCLVRCIHGYRRCSECPSCCLHTATTGMHGALNFVTRGAPAGPFVVLSLATACNLLGLQCVGCNSRSKCHLRPLPARAYLVYHSHDATHMLDLQRQPFMGGLDLVCSCCESTYFP